MRAWVGRTKSLKRSPARIGTALLLAWCVQWAAVAKETVKAGYDLTLVDEGKSWLTSYFNYQAPKLVFDGQSFYTACTWGVKPEDAGCTLYKQSQGRWVKGYSWKAHYQTPILLLDSQKRLIVIYASGAGRPPVFLRAKTPGEIDQFDKLPVPTSIPMAGYIGGGIHEDKIVFAYIGEPDVYSFNVAILDLKTMQWAGPTLLARSQRTTEPWTTWLYPIVQPGPDGIHLALSNNPDKWARYNRILYMKMPWNPPVDWQPKPEVVAPEDTNQDWTVWAMSMLRADAGYVYITGRYVPKQGTQQEMTNLYRRDPKSGRWSAHRLDTTATSTRQHESAALFQQPGLAGLWSLAVYDKEIRLFHSTDMGDTWQRVALPGTEPYKLFNSSWLCLLSPFSGSVIPKEPAAVFSNGGYGSGDDYRAWFIQLHLPKP